MLRKTALFVCRFSKTGKIPRPRDPTVAESFETKLSDQEIQILIDPKGFMSEEDKQFEAKNMPQAQKIEENAHKTSNSEENGVKPEKKPMEPEYGFKPKGPEPTRFGDWQVRGKCVDF